MLPPVSLQLLYPLALAEGEGIGVAYDYFVRRRLLAQWLKTRPRPRRLLIAGLPERYGFSLDFFLLAQEWSAELVVLDERPRRLEKSAKAFAAAQRQGYFHNLTPTYLPVSDLIQLPELTGTFDLILSSEVLQRIPPEWLPRYWQNLWQRSTSIALFAPNADNPSHPTYSDLQGVYLNDMYTFALMAAECPIKIGYMDIPPFPPGVSRSPSQREQLQVGRVSWLAMTFLEGYARLEPYFSQRWSRGRAHNVYTLATHP